MNRVDNQGPQEPPNLLEGAPRNVWLEVYQGRWRFLPRIQKAEFIIEIAFAILFFGAFAYASYFRNGNGLGLLLAFGFVGAVLGIFFYLLSRSIR